ncbi:MAG: large subunit ribosomal protein [Patescibacteria group bacterium]|jgi:large subunit ribosomal protein L4|nr:large subunit ribosomal protein [Patescibacteria group bacterium]
MKAITYTRTGNKSAETALNKSTFGVEVSHELLKQASVRSLSNTRHAGAKVLTRAEVRGGGKKPWRQKGTGRARFGSTRVNIWRHGGVAHGPTGNANFTKDLPKNMIKASIRMALTEQAANIKIIEKFSIEKPKTKLADNLIAKLSTGDNVLLVGFDTDPGFKRAVSNLVGVRYISYTKLQCYDVLCADDIIIEKEALSAIEKWLGGTKK